MQHLLRIEAEAFILKYFNVTTMDACFAKNFRPYIRQKKNQDTLVDYLIMYECMTDSSIDIWRARDIFPPFSIDE